MMVKDAFEAFILEKRVNGLSPRSIEAYRWHCLPLIRAHGEAQIEDLTQPEIYRVVLDVLDGSLAKASQSSYIRSTRIFLRWCSMEYPVKYRYEKVRVPRSPKKKIRVYTDDELLMIFGAVPGHPEWIRLRNAALIAVFFDSGIRRTEACALRRSDLDLQRGRFTVTGKGNKQRLASIGEAARLFVRRYLAACPFDSEYVFVSIKGCRLTPNAVSQMTHDLQRRLPFELSPHKLRHNFATNYCLDKYAAGEQVDPLLLKVIMGHEDLVTTQKYLHLALEMVAVEKKVSALDKKLGDIRPP